MISTDPRSHGLWERTAPSAPHTDALAGDTLADVVVIGAGYAGLSAALHLAEGGARVAVLEALDIGFGGAGRNVGLVNAGMWIMPNALNEVLGREYGDRLVQMLGNAPGLVFDLIASHAIECEAERAGTLHCAVGQAGLEQIERRAAQWLERGASVRLLDSAETAARVGTGAYRGALLDARAGTVQPLAYARGLARAALAAGVVIFTASAAQGVERNQGRWMVRTSAGRVSAQWVLVATDAYSRGPWRSIRLEQVALPYFNLATEPLTETARRTILPGKQGAWDTKTVLTSLRLDRSGRLIVGSVGALRGTGIPVHRAWAKRALRSLFPQLGKIEFEAGWYGTIGTTRNKVPFFHELAPNIVGFGGYNGRGIAPATAFGRQLAWLVLGRIRASDLPLPASMARPATLRRTKQALYELGARAAHFFDHRF